MLPDTVRERAALVQGCGLFAGLSPAASWDILSASRERNFSRRDKLFSERQPITQFVLLVAGCVKEMLFSRNGGEVILRLDGPGDLVGTTCHLETGHCSAAQAIQPSKALVWDSDKFDGLAKSFTGLQQNTARIMAERLAAMQQRFREVATDTVASRVSNELLRLVSQIGQRVNGDFQINLSREEFAQLTATTLFTVSRLLSKWENAGIVTAVREAVVVRNLPALIELAETESHYSVRGSNHDTDGVGANRRGRVLRVSGPARAVNGRGQVSTRGAGTEAASVG
jgi:CRP/FNR family transcriptional regulator, nitrogen oxide reductase regulator